MRAIILDTETTGTKDPGLLQSAWLEVDHMGEPIGGSNIPVERMWNPGKPIEYGAMATHHIVAEDICDEELASEFKIPGWATHVIGHNVDFDIQVANGCGPQPQVKAICTLALARRMWPDTDSHRLGALVYMLEGPSARAMLKNAHDAGEDVLFCQRVLQAVCQARRPADLDALWRMSEEARVPTVMPFGKHKGVPIRQLPGDYRAWLLRQQDIDPYLIRALRA